MQKVLFIGYIWPEPKTTAAGHRMLQLFSAFKAQGFKITFATTASQTEYSNTLEKLEISTAAIQLNHSSFDVFIANLNPDVVVFDRFMVEEQFGWRVAENCPNAIRILNTEDLHSLRNARAKSIKKDVPFSKKDWLHEDGTKREVASIFRSDLTLLVSNFELELLQKNIAIPHSLLLHLPFLLEEITNNKKKAWLPFEERKNMICFGNGRHAPNVDALHFLKKTIWPLIRQQLPQVEIEIYGAYLPQQVQEMHNAQNGFLIKGWVDDLPTILQKARLNLAPLRFGAGIKGKLADAMQTGTPSITTAIGAEGMHNSLPWAGLIANHPEEFAAAAVKLYRQKEKWQNAQQNGIDIINSIYNKKNLSTLLFDRITQLSKDLTYHRNQNFIGQMLQHHTVSSTKYLAKWIEVKNLHKK